MVEICYDDQLIEFHYNCAHFIGILVFTFLNLVTNFDSNLKLNNTTF